MIPFNDLPFEERKKIAYYKTETQILTIKQCLILLKNSIGEYQKKKLREWLSNCEKTLKNWNT